MKITEKGKYKIAKKKKDCSITRRGWGSERSKLKYRENEFRVQREEEKAITKNKPRIA